MGVDFDVVNTVILAAVGGGREVRVETLRRQSISCDFRINVITARFSILLDFWEISKILDEKYFGDNSVFAQCLRSVR